MTRGTWWALGHRNNSVADKIQQNANWQVEQKGQIPLVLFLLEADELCPKEKGPGSFSAALRR